MFSNVPRPMGTKHTAYCGGKLVSRDQEVTGSSPSARSNYCKVIFELEKKASLCNAESLNMQPLVMEKRVVKQNGSFGHYRKKLVSRKRNIPIPICSFVICSCRLLIGSAQSLACCNLCQIC